MKTVVLVNNNYSLLADLALGNKCSICRALGSIGHSVSHCAIQIRNNVELNVRKEKN